MAMVRSVRCWIDFCLYCHMSRLKVVSESEVVVELAAASLSSWYLKSKLLISNLIFLLGDKFLISAATSMPNKLSLVGVDCNDLLMSSIIFDSLLVFSGACLTSSLRFLLCNVNTRK